jgi:hypothetical protein
MDLLEIHKNSLENIGFWQEEYKGSIIAHIESNYKTDVLKDYYIDDLTIVNNKVLLNWKKRYMPLSPDEIKKKYGRLLEE